VLKKSREGRISAALFRLTDHHYTEEQMEKKTRHMLPKIKLIGRFDVPFLNYQMNKETINTL
jgi:hypothetical protein